ncbi:uncharacterized protein MONOS_935 [Monocercomonoides exilis]|uniref:uncharacterized protein n=1 Tax=Monocercomonoides exilis TaxID=2049356 RepID=UPI0035599C70|nr:hypothetical protein MONOS_935 [Monocercomonoides exilis]|eukprot:MONOS_935.1-p1 / transcript=MONOS_935.1 / gene=MONOS_935 / organism=Monocercomonoides_exilis_PA203 / gene_product=unspecified product / transcript_product=unspecified product / location=Mono_scaffold00015:195384-196242(-) / protein_length=197 / sequence_SO=supercontig / SO=protein_coding / is_pseudo=false
MQREGDWACPNCQFMNYARRVACFKCGASKDGTEGVAPAQVRPSAGTEGTAIRPGDWVCQACRAINFAKRLYDCYSCGCPRGARPIGFRGGFRGGMRGGFRGRRGGFAAAAGFPARRRRITPREGDWFCTACSTHNFAFRDDCRKCSAARSPTARMVTKEEAIAGYVPREGDWECPSCKARNYAFRTECFSCKAPKS